jgi:hypothetical protein
MNYSNSLNFVCRGAVNWTVVLAWILLQGGLDRLCLFCFLGDAPAFHAASVLSEKGLMVG